MSLEYFDYFCDDLNFTFVINEGAAAVYENHFSSESHAFNYERIVGSAEEVLSYIDNGLKDTGYAIISTKFDEIPAFLWFDHESADTGIGHMMFIVHQDSSYYYFVETDNILSPQRNIKYPHNSQVSMIEKRYLIDALRKNAVYYDLKINQDNLKAETDISAKIARIVDSYYCFGGEKAYMDFISWLEHSEANFLISFSELEWHFQVIAGRRFILEQCLELSRGNLFSKESEEKIHTLLMESNKAWEMAKMLIMKHRVRKIDDLSVRLKKWVVDAQRTDAELMTLLRECRSVALGSR